MKRTKKEEDYYNKTGGRYPYPFMKWILIIVIVVVIILKAFNRI
jgi:hypothetical protein